MQDPEPAGSAAALWIKLFSGTLWGQVGSSSADALSYARAPQQDSAEARLDPSAWATSHALAGSKWFLFDEASPPSTYERALFLRGYRNAGPRSPRPPRRNDAQRGAR